MTSSLGAAKLLAFPGFNLSMPDPESPPLSSDSSEELRPLEPRMVAFVQEYLLDLNGTQAAIRAGYSPNGADVTAARLLANASVAAAVAKAKAQRLSRVGMSQDSVLHEMSLLANSRVDWFCVDDQGQVQLTVEAPEGAMGAVQSIKRRTTIRTDKDGVTTKTYDVELKLWDKPTPLKLMGRHVGLFPDRVEHTGKNGGPIEAVVTAIERKIVDPAKETNG